MTHFINISYAMPDINQTTDLLSFTTYVNQGAGNLFIPLILLAIWAVVFLSSLAGSVRNSASRAWTFASLFCAIIGILFSILNLLNKRFIYLLVLMFGFGLIWMILQDSRE